MSGQSLVRFAILGARSVNYIGWQRGRGRLFRPANAFEIVAHKLLVKRRLGFSGLVRIRGPEARRIGSQSFVDPDEFVSNEAEFEFCVGNDDATRGGVFRGATIHFKSDVTQAFGKWAADLRG